jgi:hypothetical protein
MSEVKVNKISPRTNCGTVTLGDSGDSFVIPSGATITNNGTQVGFGRTGTVDWQTGSIKTSTFTAANGEGYFCNTSGGAFTVNLPAGSAGNIVSVVDYTNTFDTQNLTITPNGSQKIGGVASDAILSTVGQSVTFVYVDDTEGWKNVQDSTSNVTANDKIIASGGTVTTSGNCKIHTFTGPGTFQVTQISPSAADNAVGYLVVAGGAAGGRSIGSGGGAGGFREGRNNPVTAYTASPLVTCGHTVSVQSYPITVGAGGTYTPASPGTGGSGTASIFSSFTSAGGGGGGGNTQAGVTGGSGGGAGATASGAAGNTPPVSPPQGNNGGNGGPTNANPVGGGGGGGATAVGGNGSQPSTTGNCGGAGATTHITGSPVAYAGGGGGANQNSTPQPSGGTGGGGNGGMCTTAPGLNGETNKGGGGGGEASGSTGAAGNGGSGIVIIRYKYQ